MIKSHFFAVIIALIAAFAFGISTPLSKLLVADLNPFLLAGLLYLGAGIGLAPFSLLGPKDDLLGKIKANSQFVLGMIFFGGLLGPVLLMMAIKMASAASISLWLNLELAATAFLGHFIFKDYMGRRAWVSVLVSLFAGGLLSYGGGGAGILAGILVALACFCWGLDNHYTALIDNLSPVQSTVIKGLCAGSTNFIIGLALSGWTITPTLSLKAMAVGFVCYGVSIALYIASAQKLGAVRSQLLFSIAPIFGVVGSLALLHEKLSLVQIISGGLLICSAWLMLSEKHSHLHEHEAREHSHQHSHDDLHHAHHGDTQIGSHSHIHRHIPLSHKHMHCPDLHHRHGH